MGWARSSFLAWLGVSLAAGCSGKYESGPDEPPLSGANAGGSGPAASAAGGRSTAPHGGSATAGRDPMATTAGTGSAAVAEVTLNCGTWVRCDDSSRCAAGEDCIALQGCERGICATPRLVCQLYCGSTACESAPVGLTRISLSCPDTRLDGFESSAGSGGYPPGYPM